MTAAVNRGYVAVAVNYLQQTESGTPNIHPLQIASQARCAIRFLKKNSADYLVTEQASFRINPNKIAVFGHSLGGLAAGPIGLLNDSEWQTSRQAVTLKAAQLGLTYLEGVLDRADAINRVDSHSNPINSNVQALILASTSTDFLAQSTLCESANTAFSSVTRPAGCALYNASNPYIAVPADETINSQSYIYRNSFSKVAFQTYLTEHANGREVVYPDNTVHLLDGAVQLLDAASPARYAGASEPATLLMGDTGDLKVMEENSILSGRLLRKKGNFAKTVVVHLPSTITSKTAHNFFYGSDAAASESQNVWMTFLDIVFNPAFNKTNAQFEAIYKTLPGHLSTSDALFCQGSALPRNCDSGT